jgi:hypothetical protein
MDHADRCGVPLRMTLLLIVLAAVASPGVAQRPPVIGIVELPGLFGTRDPDGPPGLTPPRHVQPIPIHVAPTSGSDILARVTDAQEIEVAEYDYEAPGALTHDVRDGWNLIGVVTPAGRTSGWLPPQYAGRLHSLPTLLVDGLAYLTEAWDRKLFPAAGAASTGRLLDVATGRADVIVRQARESGGRLWLEVDVLGPGRCRQADPPPVVARGWVPAHASDGRPNAWFYSRGC